MAKITIDGREVEARTETNLLQVCLEEGANLPYFCWHPELGSVGACRQCAVKQYANPEDKRGRIVMACMTPVTEGAIISVDDPEVKEFRSGVVEWLMTNHPHDCPVCEEGGECHLQDMTVMTEHRSRRYRFEKRTHHNQDLGPFVKHEMNRCIACYRCVRFYRDYAGGQDLGVFASHNNVYFGRFESGTLESPFSGNLVEICPTGVFTDKPFSKVYSRKWDMRGAPSICANCGAGCNILLNERAGKLRRVLNRYHADVNRYFLCDRGRFGHSWVNAPTRLRAAGYRMDEEMLASTAQHVLDQFARIARDRPLVGIGSPRASLEANFALRELVGEKNFSTGVAEPQHSLSLLAAELLQSSGARIASFADMEQSDGALILGEDVSATAPRMSLALRQIKRTAFDKAADAARVPRWMDAAVRTLGQDTPSPLFVISPAQTDLDAFAGGIHRAMPQDAARIGFAVAHLIDPEAPRVSDLTPAEDTQAQAVAEFLLNAENPLIVSGTQYASQALLRAASSIARALARRAKRVSLSFVLPEANSLGVALLGGMSLDAIHSRAAAATVIVLENDLSRRLSPESLTILTRKADHLVVLDHSVTPTAIAADIVFPTAAHSENDGTFINFEGRAQRFFQIVYPDKPIQSAWKWVRDLASVLGKMRFPKWQKLDDVIDDLCQKMPQLASIDRAAPNADYRYQEAHLRSQTHRVSGRTAIRADISVRDKAPPASADTPLHATMEGSYGPDMPAAVVPYYHAPAWNSVSALNRFQSEIGGEMRGGPSGIRLWNPENASQGGQYSAEIPDAFVAREGEFYLLPEYRVFGTDEMGSRCDAIMERVTPATLHVGGDIAGASRAEIRIGDETYILPVQASLDLPKGVAFCPPHMVSRAWSSPIWVKARLFDAENMQAREEGVQ